MSDPSSLPRLERQNSKEEALDHEPILGPQLDPKPSHDDHSPKQLGGEALNLGNSGNHEVQGGQNGVQGGEGNAPAVVLPAPGNHFNFRGLANKLGALDAQQVRDALPNTPEYHTSANIHAMLALLKTSIIGEDYLGAHMPTDQTAAGVLLTILENCFNYPEYIAPAITIFGRFGAATLKNAAEAAGETTIRGLFDVAGRPEAAAIREPLLAAAGPALKLASVLKPTLAACLTSVALRTIKLYEQYKAPLQTSDLGQYTIDDGNVAAIIQAIKAINDLGDRRVASRLLGLLPLEQRTVLLTRAQPGDVNGLQAIGTGPESGPWKEAAQEVLRVNPNPPLALKTLLTGLSLGVRIHLPEGEEDPMKKTTGKNSPHVFRNNALDRMAQVLPQLPDSHVANNPSLGEFVREKNMSNKNRFKQWGASVFKQATAGGVYYGNKTLGMEYNNKSLNQPSRDNSMTDQGDVLRDVQNEFNATLRHEVGHAVDDALGLSKTYCTLPEGGGWKEYAKDNADLINDLWQDAVGTDARLNAAITSLQLKARLNARIAEEVAREACRLYADGTRDLKTALVNAAQTKSPTYQPTANEVRQAADELGNSQVIAILKGCRDAESCWQGIAPNIQGHRYQASYGKDSWVRYNVDARNRKVSKYQFRAPGEWVAEAYAAYYEPATSDQTNRLRQADPVTWAFFKTQVDVDITGKALQTAGVQQDVAQIVQARAHGNLDQHVQETLNPPQNDVLDN